MCGFEAALIMPHSYLRGKATQCMEAVMPGGPEWVCEKSGGNRHRQKRSSCRARKELAHQGPERGDRVPVFRLCASGASARSTGPTSIQKAAFSGVGNGDCGVLVTHIWMDSQNAGTVRRHLIRSRSEGIPHLSCELHVVIHCSIHWSDWSVSPGLTLTMFPSE